MSSSIPSSASDPLPADQQKAMEDAEAALRKESNRAADFRMVVSLCVAVLVLGGHCLTGFIVRASTQARAGMKANVSTEGYTKERVQIAL